MHNDTELFTIAQALLEQRHTPPVHTVAAALRCQSGEVISAVNIDHFLGFVCAETAALAIAINRGVYDFDSVVAVRKNDDTDKIEIVDMCGKCRQIFHDYAPGVTVLTTRARRQSSTSSPMLIFTNVQKFNELLSDNIPITEVWTNSEDSIDGYYIDTRKKITFKR